MIYRLHKRVHYVGCEFSIHKIENNGMWLKPLDKFLDNKFVPTNEFKHIKFGDYKSENGYKSVRLNGTKVV